MGTLLNVTGLRVRRGATFELAIPKLRLNRGEILCVAGPNGSGKTTLIDCLVGLLRPDAGTITVDGWLVDGNLRTMKNRIGYVPDDEAWLIKELCAEEYFALLATVYRQAGVPGDLKARTTALAKTLYFTNFRQPLETLSHGNKKKVQLIAGLMHRPKLLVVDELRNGLDTLAAIAAEQLLRQEAKRGACIVAATHDLWWAERVAGSAILLADGCIAASGQIKQLVQKYGSLEHLFLTVASPEQGNAA